MFNTGEKWSVDSLGQRIQKYKAGNKVLQCKIIIAVLALFLTSTITQGAEVSGRKSVTWRVRANDPADLIGVADMMAKTKASCVHDPQPWQMTTETVSWSLAAGTLGGPAGARGKFWTNEFSDGLHSWAYSEVSVDAAPAIGLGSPTEHPRRYEMEVISTVEGEEGVDSPHQGHATGKHNGKVTYSLKGAKATGSNLRGEINGLRVGPHYFPRRPMGAINERGASIHDPFIITLIDLDTGTTLTEELMSIDIDSGNGVDNDMDWEYDLDLGISMSVSGFPGAYVDISGSAGSSWLVNQTGDFGASLSGGIFEATGAWASLPWSLTYAGTDVIGATLAPEYMPGNLDYMIPDDLLEDGHLYEQRLTVDDETLGSVAIPEPATICLLGAGGLALLRRQ